MTPALAPWASRAGRAPVAIAGGLALCLALDTGLLAWTQAGPPTGKGQVFFLELVLLLAGAAVFTAAAFAAPERLRPAIPAILVILAWHTGFQIDLSRDGVLVLSGFDALIPLIVLLALLGRWYRAVSVAYLRVCRSLAVFWAFAVWGVGLALARGVDPVPFLANLKSFLVYPLIALLIPLCIHTRRQLYGTVGLMLLLILERALEGLREGASSSTKTLLANGQVVARIDGHMDSVNQYACYILTGLLLLLALVVLVRSARLRLVLAGPTLILALALLLTLSRGAWLATAFGIVVLAGLAGLRRSLTLLAAGLVGTAMLFAVQPHALGLVSGRVGRYDHSIQERQSFLALGLRVVESYPLGAGWGAGFVDTPTGLQPSSQAPWYHDDYLQLASEIGIPGLLSFLAVWGVILGAILRAFRRVQGGHRALLAGLLASSAGILLQAATEQMLWQPNIAPHFWIVAGLGLAATDLSSPGAVVAQRVARGASTKRAMPHDPARAGHLAGTCVPRKEGDEVL